MHSQDFGPGFLKFYIFQSPESRFYTVQNLGPKIQSPCPVRILHNGLSYMYEGNILLLIAVMLKL